MLFMAMLLIPKPWRCPHAALFDTSRRSPQCSRRAAGRIAEAQRRSGAEAQQVLTEKALFSHSIIPVDL